MQQIGQHHRPKPRPQRVQQLTTGKWRWRSDHQGILTGQSFDPKQVLLALFHFFIIPGTNDPGVFYFIVSIMWLFVLALSATLITNLYQRALLTIPTIVQCAVLGLSAYLIPIAIWGGVLLHRRLQRAKIAG